ncbi:unnamed protein product [Adineta steineri]|uniref:Uncharacterized protein n=1 Tax=Adineta steineri TaxID=433720 RepID=A0A815B570_9BILA|nr:unnamed protein product [Adineta steineri]
MAMTNNKTRCFTCNKEKITYFCKGCSKEFCFMDLAEHHKRLNEELHHIIDDYNAFKERINEQKQNPQNHAVINQIDQWEIDSIEKIKQKAKECREIVIKLSQTFINDIEKKFNDLTEQIQQLQKENDFNEINFNYLTNQLIEITEELTNPSSISIQRESQSFMKEISIVLSKRLTTNWYPVVAFKATIGTLYMQAQKYNISSCNCATMPACVESMSLELNSGSNWTVPGMMIGCLPLESMLQSTLECIYDEDCLNTITETLLAKSILPLSSTRTRFKPINTTKLTTIASELFIEDWGVEFAYEKYFTSCQPKTCSYTSSERFRIKDSMGTIFTIYGGICILLQFIIPIGYKLHFFFSELALHISFVIVGRNGQGNQLNVPMSLSFDGEGNLYVTDRWNHRIEKFKILL